MKNKQCYFHCVFAIAISLILTYLCGCGGGSYSFVPANKGSVSVNVSYPQDLKTHQGSGQFFLLQITEKLNSC